MKNKLITIIKFDVLTLFASKFKLIFPLSYFLIIFFTVIISSNQKQDIILFSMTIALIFASFLGNKYIFEDDYNNGTINHCIFTGIKPYQIILAKIISHFICINLPIILLITTISYIDDNNSLSLFYLFINSLFFAFFISSLSIFTSCLTINAENNFLITPIITIPLSISNLLLFFSAINSANIANVNNNIFFIEILIGMNLLFTPIFCFFSSLIISNQK